jgi:CheY-like chemotaxis protein
MDKATSCRILIIHDDGEQAGDLARALGAVGFAVSCHVNSVDGLIAVEDERPDLVILDWSLPFIDGAIFIRALHTGMRAPPPILALTPPEVTPETALAAGAHACLPASADRDTVVQVASRLLARRLSSGGETAGRGAAHGRRCPPRPRPRRRPEAARERPDPACPRCRRAALPARAPWGLRVLFHSPPIRRAALGVLLVQQVLLYARMVSESLPPAGVRPAEISQALDGLYANALALMSFAG